MFSVPIVLSLPFIVRIHSSGQVQPAAPQPSLPLRVACPVWDHALMHSCLRIILLRVTLPPHRCVSFGAASGLAESCWGEAAGHMVGKASGVCVFDARLPYSGPRVAGSRLTLLAGHTGIREKGT